MYVVKNTYEKTDADVLLEYSLGPGETLSEIFKDPRVVAIDWFRSTDRTYGQSYIVWESEETYNAWAEDHNEAHEQGKQEIEAYMQAMGITFQRLYPPYKDCDWKEEEFSHPKVTLEHQISWEQIFE